MVNATHRSRLKKSLRTTVVMPLNKLAIDCFAPTKKANK
jgi:hypothetical protein